MHASPAHLTGTPIEDLLKDGTLAGDWILDPARSAIRLQSSVLGGLVRVKGAFRDITGNGAVSPEGRVTGTVTIATASIDTGNARRDAHLRSADFFDSATIADITFTADEASLSGQGVAVTGELTVHDRTRPLSFDAAVSVRADGEIWLDAEVHVNRSDFGLTWNFLGMVSASSTVSVHAVFTGR